MENLRAGDPAKFGQYHVLGRLGSGEVGDVFFGNSFSGVVVDGHRPESYRRDAIRAGRVAIRVVRPELAGDPGFRAEFERQVQAARRVESAFVAPAVGADTRAASPWLATKWADGLSLKAAVEGHGPLPPHTVRNLAVGLAKGLAAVHKAGISHGDLKPSNVLLTRSGPQLVDAGISAAARSSQAAKAGTLFGTPEFMSPEQALGGPAGPASDIFSLGAVLAFAASGEYPYKTGSLTDVRSRVLNLAPRLEGVPAELRPLIERCMKREPTDRPTASQFLDDLTKMNPDAVGWPDHEWPYRWLPDSIPGAARPEIRWDEWREWAEWIHDEWDKAEASFLRNLPPKPAPVTLSPQAAPGLKLEEKENTRNKRRRWGISIAVTATISIAVAITLTLTHGSPFANGPSDGATATGSPGASALEVQQPADPTVRFSSPTVAEITWSYPANGPAPDTFEILVNGKKADTVPAGTMTCSAVGLVPGTVYHFTVVAVLGSRRSASPARTVTAPALPLSDSPLNWKGLVTYQITSGPSDLSWPGTSTPWQDDWVVSADCTSGPCDATLKGNITADPFTMTLSRADATYSGSIAINDLWSCKVNGEYYYMDTTLSITITAAHTGETPEAQGSVTFSGTATWNVKPNQECGGGTYTIRLQSAQEY